LKVEKLIKEEKTNGMRRICSLSQLHNKDEKEKGAELTSIFRPFEEEYTVGETLGTGGYAVVMKATHKATGQVYAVKIMKIGKNTEDDESKDEEDEDEDEEDEDDDDVDELTFEQIIDNEIGLVQKLEHPNIIKLKEYFINFNKCYIVMDLLEGPVLLDALLEMGKYTETDAKLILGRLLDAVAYMHLQNVVHRDLKLENLVLKRPGDLSSVVIVDFGFAKAARAREKMQEVVGTPWYSAPELLLADPYTPAVDLWALGVELYMLLIGEFPFDDPDEEALEDQIIEGKVDMTGPQWEHISIEAKDLLKGLLSVDPKHRPTATEALEHAWFTGLAGNSSASLHHAHTRLRELAGATRLPTRTFAPGEYLVHQGQRGRGKSVYMIVSGECEVLVRAGGGAEAEEVKVGMRRVGNFIGGLGVKPAAQQQRSRTRNRGAGGIDFTTWKTPAMRRWLVALTVVQAARQWVGHRRNTSVRALTPVSVIVLAQSDMQWAVEHDYRLSAELQDAMKRQRKALRVSLKQEARRRASEDEQHSPAESPRSSPYGTPTSARTSMSSSGYFKSSLGPDQVKAFKAGVERILNEYFESMDLGEAAAQLTSLEEVCGGAKMPYLVKRAVAMSLDKTMRERELVALLITGLTPVMLTLPNLVKGFRMLLEAAEDLRLDIPDAPDQIMMFVARAIVDEVMSPADLERLREDLHGSIGGQVASAAMSLTQARHSTERVLMAWGGGGAGTVAHSKERMGSILEEFVHTKNLSEAAACLHNLKVPHFHHEFVKKALTAAVEAPEHAATLLRLLRELNSMGLVTENQAHIGFRRMHDIIEDLELDVPGAQSRLTGLEEEAAKLGLYHADDIYSNDPWQPI